MDYPIWTTLEVSGTLEVIDYCMTLFLEADPECAEFRKVLEKYYGGKKDQRTLAILRKQSEG